MARLRTEVAVIEIAAMDWTPLVSNSASMTGGSSWVRNVCHFWRPRYRIVVLPVGVVAEGTFERGDDVDVLVREEVHDVGLALPGRPVFAAAGAVEQVERRARFAGVRGEDDLERDVAVHRSRVDADGYGACRICVRGPRRKQRGPVKLPALLLRVDGRFGYSSSMPPGVRVGFSERVPARRASNRPTRTQRFGINRDVCLAQSAGGDHHGRHAINLEGFHRVRAGQRAGQGVLRDGGPRHPLPSGPRQGRRTDQVQPGVQ